MLKIIPVIMTSDKSPAPGVSSVNRIAADCRPNAQIGFPDRNGGGSGSWNWLDGTRGCAQTDLPKTHGQGLFYCSSLTQNISHNYRPLNSTGCQG